MKGRARRWREGPGGGRRGQEVEGGRGKASTCGLKFIKNLLGCVKPQARPRWWKKKTII